jgi:hypothetical protein
MSVTAVRLLAKPRGTFDHRHPVVKESKDVLAEIGGPPAICGWRADRSSLLKRCKRSATATGECPVRGPRGGDFTQEHNHGHTDTQRWDTERSRGRCGVQVSPHNQWHAGSTESRSNKPDSTSGWA